MNTRVQTLLSRGLESLGCTEPPSGYRQHRAASYANHMDNKKGTGLGSSSLVEAEGEAQAELALRTEGGPGPHFRPQVCIKQEEKSRSLG